jgi:hypothetical protein
MSELAAYDSLTPEVRTALTALCTEHCWLKDHLQAELIPALYTEDGRYETPLGGPNGTVIEGRSALTELWGTRTKSFLTRTLLANMRFVQDSPTSVRGWISFSEFAAHMNEMKVALPMMVGEWVDTYEKGADSRWKIKSRKVEIRFGGPRAV